MGGEMSLLEHNTPARIRQGSTRQKSTHESYRTFNILDRGRMVCEREMGSYP